MPRRPMKPVLRALVAPLRLVEHRGARIVSSSRTSGSLDAAREISRRRRRARRARRNGVRSDVSPSSVELRVVRPGTPPCSADRARGRGAAPGCR